LKAVFYNVPAGLTLSVSNGALNTVPSVTVSGTTSPVIGGTSLSPYAVLVATSSAAGSENKIDRAGFDITDVVGGAPVPHPVVLTADSTGRYTAIWEVTNSNPSATDVLTFGVYVTYTPGSATTANPYGTPITDLPVGVKINDVQMSMAPEPSNGLFTITNGTQGQNPIPKFISIGTYEGRFLTVNLCQTTLLYPFVTSYAGFDTGIAVANTSTDPWNTIHQTGTCRLYE
jgi:hypothetical protein